MPADPHRKTQGLYGKFLVSRTDGRDAAGEKHEGCTYFVLDLRHDPVRKSARKYADVGNQLFKFRRGSIA